MNKEVDLIINKEARNNFYEHIEVLEKVKAIPYLTNDFILTSHQVANYYEVDKTVIDSILSRNKEELESNGLKILKYGELRKFKANLQDASIIEKFKYVSKLALYTKKTLLNVGMLLTESPIAEKVRRYLLNIEDNSSEIQKNDAVSKTISQNQNIELKNKEIELDYKKISNAKIEEEFKLITIKSSIEKCKIYNISEEDSLILIQQAIVNKESIDEAILNEIKNRKNSSLQTKRRIMKIKIDYIAKNYFNGNYPEVYHELSKKLKYRIGVDIELSRSKKDKNKLSYFDYIAYYNAYDLANNILIEIIDDKEEKAI